MKNKTKLAFIFSAVMGSCFFVARASADMVYITQAQITGGSGHTSDDFVEIFNPSPTPFNLKGYRLVKRTQSGSADTSIKSWTADTFIPPYSFYLWANSSFTLIAKIPDTATSATIANDNGVAIRLGPNDSGTIVDSVAWGASNNGFANVSSVNPSGSMAIFRQDLYATTSTYSINPSNPRNTSVADHLAPSGSFAPPAATTTPLSEASPGSIYVNKSSDIKISEILPDPEGEDGGAEKVELFNEGETPVDLEGWYLDDQNSGLPKPSAFKISGQSILPGGFLVLTIPKGFFTLNNVGGDSLNLFFADKVLADSAELKSAALEGQSLQKFAGAWLWANPSWGQENFGQSRQKTENFEVYVNEILPNPKGPDEGREWLEIYNRSALPVNLKGYILDSDGLAGQINSNALVLDEKAVVPQGGFFLVNLSEDQFSLSNARDAVRFFNPQKKLLERTMFSDAAEGQSYSRNEKGDWSWTLPSPGKENIIDLPNIPLRISELLPNPQSGQEEFVEIVNIGKEEIGLEGFILHIGSKSLKLPAAKLSAGGYYVVSEDDLPARLRNLGQELSLEDSFGRRFSEVVYPEAPAGQAYALTQGGNYVWTNQPTAKLPNQIVLGENTKESAPKAKALAPQKNFSQENIQLKQELLTLQAQVALLSEKIQGLSDNLTVQTVDASQNAQNEAAPAPVSAGGLGRTYLLISGAALLGLLIFGFKYGKNVL